MLQPRIRCKNEGRVYLMERVRCGRNNCSFRFLARRDADICLVLDEPVLIGQCNFLRCMQNVVWEWM